MSSKLCNIQKMYGKDLSVSITDAPPEIIKANSKRFIKNSLLISSVNNSENDFEDDEYPAIFATDYEGNSLQLTYAIEQGNGLYINDNSHLGLNIDNNTIQENESTLFVDTDSLNKCGIGEFGIVKVEEEINKINDIFPKSSYISVNDSGTLYLADSFYNYMWKYVKDEIIKAIQPLIPKNFSGYLIKGIKYNPEGTGNKLENGSGEHIYESNSTNISSKGSIYDFGFYYTSDENISTSIHINDPENNLMVLNNSPIATITQASNYYNVVTYGHEFGVEDNSNANYIPPFKVIFPPNFYRSGNSFIRKEHTLAITINGESDNSEWKNRKLYFHFSQDPGDYKIVVEDPRINVVSLIHGEQISLTFIYNNFPLEIDPRIQNLVKYNVSLIWDKNGNALELYTNELDLNNINPETGENKFIASWSSLEKNGLTDLLNPKITTEDNSEYKISNLYQSKKYTLRISVLNSLNNSEISKWDYDFTVTYSTMNQVVDSRSTVRNIYLSEVCIGNDDSYVVVEDVPETGTIGLEWVYANNQQSLRGRKGVSNTHGEKIDRINSLFSRKYNDRMTLLFDFQYKDEDINSLSDEVYDLVFNEDSFNIKLELVDKEGNILKKTINDNGEESNDISRYSKSVKNPNDDIHIDITDISVNSKNKNIKITFRKIIDPELFIRCIRNDESYDDNYYNFVYMNVIIGNYYMTTQSFTIKVDVDSLVMNTIPYSFEDGIVDVSETYYLNYVIDEPMELYGSIINVLNSALGYNDDYKIELLSTFSGYNTFNNLYTNSNNDLTISTDNNNGYISTINITNNEVGRKYNLLLKIIKISTNENVYLKYIQFRSNMVDCELPGFKIVNRNYHYIYLASSYNPYDDGDNYNALVSYDGKELQLNNGNINDFTDYLSNYMVNGLDIQNNSITLINNDDKLMYCMIADKYKIDSQNNPLLYISFGEATEFNSPRPKYLTEDNSDQNNEEKSNLYSNSDGNGIYDLIKLSEKREICKLVNVYPNGYQKNGKGYSIDSGDAPQQLADSYRYNQESLEANITLPLIIKPSDELKTWLYNAKNVYNYYGAHGIIENLLSNIFNDLLSDVLDQTIIAELVNSASSNIVESGGQIDFEGTCNLAIQIDINGNSYYYGYGSSMYMSLLYGSDGYHETNDPYFSIKYDYNDDSKSRVISNNGRSTLSAYKCDFSTQYFDLLGFNSNFVSTESKSIDFNSLVLDTDNSTHLNDLIYYLDYTKLYPGKTNLDNPGFSWSKNVCYVKEGQTTPDGGLPEFSNPNNVEDINISSSDTNKVEVEGTTITIKSISYNDKVKITANKQSENEQTGKWYAKQESFYIIGYKDDTLLIPTFEWPKQSISFDYTHAENLERVILNNEYNEPVKYQLVVINTSGENPVEDYFYDDHKYSAGENATISIDSNTGELIGFNAAITWDGIEIHAEAYIDPNDTYYSKEYKRRYEIKKAQQNNR